MRQLSYSHGTYQSPVRKIGWLARRFPSVTFYTKMMALCAWGSLKCRLHRYDREQWVTCSHDIIKALESVGVRVEISGTEHLQAWDGPVVIVANHMSMLETLFLPGIIQPFRDMGYIAKQSLLDYPFFKYLVRFGEPIGVSRTDPRQDLRVVLEGGPQRILQGISMVVFLHPTRSTTFATAKITTLGLKLALKANVPVLPLALKTDAWTNGTLLKDFGRIETTKTVRFAFGPPFPLTGRGNEQHQAVIDFIGKTLKEWESLDDR